MEEGLLKPQRISLECERAVKAIQENPSIKCANALHTVKVLDTLAKRSELDPKHVEDIMKMIASLWHKYALYAAHSPNLLKFIDEHANKEYETFTECLRCMCMQGYTMSTTSELKTMALMDYLRDSWSKYLQTDVAWGDNYPDQKVMIADLLQGKPAQSAVRVHFCARGHFYRHLRDLLEHGTLRREIIKEIEGFPSQEGLIMIEVYQHYWELDPDIAITLVPKMCSMLFDQRSLIRRYYTTKDFTEVYFTRLMAWLVRNGHPNDVGRLRHILSNATYTFDDWEICERISEYFRHIRAVADDNHYFYPDISKKLLGIVN